MRRKMKRAEKRKEWRHRTKERDRQKEGAGAKQKEENLPEASVLRLRKGGRPPAGACAARLEAPGCRRGFHGDEDAPGGSHRLLRDPRLWHLGSGRSERRRRDALCLVLGCMIFPDGWDAETIRDMCGAKTGKYSLGDCSVRWAYILAIIGILNALILSFLAFVLGNRQTDLLQEELKPENKDFVGSTVSSVLRPGGDVSGWGVLPCPVAHSQGP
nr:LHFPL tetraspan subfamily member 4 protein isoform X2 [Macaca nemestrina]